MSAKQPAPGPEVQERFAALVSNANAVRAVAAAVASTIGPKGLDVLLVDKFGDSVITNDGITILTRLDVSHPAARLVVASARAQEEEVGDGTTTASIMAGALLAEATNHALRGVPVARLLVGLDRGVTAAQEALAAITRPVTGPDDPVLRAVATVAGRGHADVAELVVTAARLVGAEKLADPSFHLADGVVARARATNEVFLGVVVDREPANRQMPTEVAGRVLVLDDALEPERLGDEALATEAGFARQLELQEEFRRRVTALPELGVRLVAASRGLDPWAEEFLTDAGVMVLTRVLLADQRRLVEHSGARPLKRTGLARPAADLERWLGSCQRAYHDRILEHVRVLGGGGRPLATMVVGAATAEVVAERRRITADAAGAVAAAIRGGVVPGGGAAELWAARQVERLAASLRGMESYGAAAVAEALRRPLAQIVTNAGYNALEKVSAVAAAQEESGQPSLAVDCDTGEVADMAPLGVWDPAPVKFHALRAAAEVAAAILRIDTVVKMKDGGGVPASPV